MYTLKIILGYSFADITNNILILDVTGALLTTLGIIIFSKEESANVKHSKITSVKA